MTKESDIEKLKLTYFKIMEKYHLPPFKELNEDFVIEKISEHETEILIREIRRFVGDKMVNYMRFIENLLNPVNVPMFMYSIIKQLSQENKKKLSNIYKILVGIEIKFIELDLEFSEEKEAEFIKDSFKIWQGIKKELLEILQQIDVDKDTKLETKNKGYFD